VIPPVRRHNPEVGLRIGVVFPQTEIGADRGAVRAYAAAVTGSGYQHLATYDHVLGADLTDRPDWRGPYHLHTMFHEPLVLFGFLAAITPIELVTSVIILPQRQTALVAKQAAEVDLLTGGRFRLGVGIGWNPVEYEALGKDFTDRGRRIGAQVALLRRLWTEQSVTSHDRFEQVSAAGLAPLPIQRPIPVWFGASQPPALRRAGRLADGWFPQRAPGAGFEEAKAIVDTSARAAGRDPPPFEGRVNLTAAGPDQVVADIAAWRAAGASHVSVNTMGAGLPGVDGHIAALAETARLAGLAGPAGAGSG
jgi:probable F420-dependent oxidoreductase